MHFVLILKRNSHIILGVNMSKKITEIVDGNTACAEMAYNFTEVAVIYPITPSSPMAELIDQWSTQGKKNIFGNEVLVKQMQSEGGAAGALHGLVQTGSLASSFTSSQGLLLMIPNMYKIAGQCLPAVLHVSARALATHALSIFGDHSDVMSTRSTGFCIVCSKDVQECYDMALFSHIMTLKCSLPFLHFFDGFRTSHEMQKIKTLDINDIKNIFPYKKYFEFKNHALTPTNPLARGTSQNPDVYFQNRERANSVYEDVNKYAFETFKDIERISGRHYAPFEYYGASDAENIIVSMGSSVATIKEYVEYFASRGEKIGVINVRLCRPFFDKEFIKILPKTTKKIAVLDRTKESGSVGEPLMLDVVTSLAENNINIKVFGGRYGLGGKEFDLACVKAVFDNLNSQNSKNHFTVGIDDDLTHSSLELSDFDITENCFEMKFYGLGSDGTVSANKNSIKIIGEKTNKFVQAFFEYDSKKSGSLTTSHIRISDAPINRAYKPKRHDLIAIHNFTFVARYDLISSLKDNGIVLLNTKLSENDLAKVLPREFLDNLKKHKAKLYVIDAQKIANENGLGRKINTIMQTAFFKIANIGNFKEIVQEIKDNAKRSYQKKGDDVVLKNYKCIDEAIKNVKEVDYTNFTYSNIDTTPAKTDSKFFDNVILPIEKLKGDNLPVSKFNVDGSISTNTSKYLKRGIAINLPKWIKENCIQCGNCTLACPHSALRSILTKSEQADQTYIDAMAMPGYKFKIQLSPLDCTGCGVCANTCPAIKKALEMVDFDKIEEKEQKNYENSLKVDKYQSIFKKNSAKGLQFFDPYFEFSYACAGCGETPYIKILTQLFGDKMIVANATGCSSIYGGSYPVCPYAKDKDDHGVAWANSLFEDNAEFGYGMALSQRQNQNTLLNVIEKILPKCEDELKPLLNKFLTEKSLSYEEQTKIKTIATYHLSKNNDSDYKMLLGLCDYLVKKSIWIIGGDGWAYDIGYGGLDHVLNSGENVNVLVLDSEVYSNTGGQASKASPRGSVEKFSANGKITQKKDLGAIFMANKNCYVASVSLGADPNQTIKALAEAEAFDGPSIVICYAPCINHGFDMSMSHSHMKLCVECGYWNLYRFNPTLEKPLTLDSGEPTKDYMEFLNTETRFTSLKKIDSSRAEQLFKQSAHDAEQRRKFLKDMLKIQNNDE